MSTDTTLRQPPADDRPAKRRGYWSLWATVPREFAFLILTMPIAIIALVVLATAFFSGLGLIAIVVGIFIVVATLYAARGFGTLELVRLDWAGRPRIARPVWERSDISQGFWRTTWAPFIDGHYWLYLLHGMIINPIVSVISWSITVAWTSVALGGTTAWIWYRTIPDGRNDTDFWLHDVVIDFLFPGNTWNIDPLLGEALFEFVVGLIFLVTLPFIFRGLTLLHDVIARGTLGAWRSEALEREVAQLAASRGAAVQAEDASLRLRARHPRRPPAAAGTAADGSRDDRAQARTRSRAGSRFDWRSSRPGPRDARRTACALARVRAADPAGPWPRGRPAVPRHSQPGAGHRRGRPSIGCLGAGLDRTQRLFRRRRAAHERRQARRGAGHPARGVDPRHGAAGHWLDLWVTDNGRGGATVTAGHGLAGLAERVQGLRGMFVVDSPVGGPTAIGAHIPYTPVAASFAPPAVVGPPGPHRTLARR